MSQIDPYDKWKDDQEERVSPYRRFRFQDAKEVVDFCPPHLLPMIAEMAIKRMTKVLKEKGPSALVEL